MHSFNILAVVTMVVAGLAEAMPQLASRGWAGDDSRLIYTCTQPNTLAMTFDDGPHIYTSGLLKLLKQEGVKATFFVNGENFGNIRDAGSQAAVKQAYADGHQIGSYTWSHADLATLPLAGVQDQMKQLDSALKEIIGVRPVYMRPPYGSTSEEVITTLRGDGYKIVIWDIETKDTDHPNDVAAGFAAYNVLNGAERQSRGWIALQHDPVASTSEHLAAQAIALGKRLKYKFTTVAECLGDGGGAYRA